MVVTCAAVIEDDFPYVVAIGGGAPGQ